jgi:hypothetical protein
MASEGPPQAEFHVARGGNASGKPSSLYGRSNDHLSSPESRSPCVSPRHDAGVGGAGPHTGGLVCPRLHGETSRLLLLVPIAPKR